MSPETPGPASNELPASVERERQLLKASPRTADVLHEFRDRVQYGDVNAKGEFVPNPDGQKFQIDISDQRGRDTWKAMRKRYREVAAGVQHEKSATLNPIKMRDPRGGHRFVSEALVPTSGFREASALSGVGVLRTRLDESKFCPACGLRWSWCECAR